MSTPDRLPAEGKLYDVFTVAGHTIPVYYGYPDEADRHVEQHPGENLIPITPDFIKTPLYDARGAPLVTDIQEPCAYYKPDNPDDPEVWCRDCVYFPADKPKIGVCRCEKRKKTEE